MTAITSEAIERLASRSETRENFWVNFINATGITIVAEVGVFRGHFAEKLLQECPPIKQYYMVDPWRNLEQWNKPANVSNEMFDAFLTETLARTDFASEKRIVLRGKTTEVIDKIPDESLDFAYIDADHTLKGITVDLLKVFGKVRPGGWIGGDDFCESIWQHDPQFEPTFVFPFAVYFAEAVDSVIYGLPHRQFLIHKGGGQSFTFKDLTGNYGSIDLLGHMQPITPQKKNPTTFYNRVKHLVRHTRKKTAERSK